MARGISVKMHSILRSEHGKEMGWAENHVKQRVLVVKIYDPEREPGRPYLFFHTQNDRHGVSLFLRSSICWRTIFVDGSSRSSATLSRPFESSVPRFIAAHPASFHFPPFVVVIVSFFFRRFSEVRRWLEPLRSTERRETSGIQNSPWLRRLECREHATGTNQTFIRHDQNVSSTTTTFHFMCVCEKNSLVRSCACRFADDRNSVSFDVRAKIAGKFDDTLTRTNEIPTIRAIMASFHIVGIIYSV